MKRSALLFLFLLFVIKTEAQKPELVIQTGHTKSIRTMAFSHDGKLLASAGLDYKIILWDIKTGMELRELSVKAQISQLVFSHDDRYLVSCSGNYSSSPLNDNTVRKWDLASGTEVLHSESFRNSLTCVDYSNDGKYIVTGEDWNNLYVMDASDLNIVHKTIIAFSKITRVIFNADSKVIAAASDNKVFLFDSTLSQNPKTITTGFDEINKMFFMDDDIYIFGHNNGYYYLKSWNQKTLKANITSQPVNEGIIGISQDLKYFVTASKGINVYLYPSLKPYSEYTYPPSKDYFFYETSISISPDCNTVAYSFNEDIVLWDISSKRVIKTLKSQSPEFDAVAVSPDGKTMASYNEGLGLSIWDARESRLKSVTDWKYDKVYDKDVRDLFFLGSENKIIAQHSRYTLLWDADNGSENKISQPNAGPVSFSNNKKFALSFDRNPLEPVTTISPLESGTENKSFSFRKEVKTGVLLTGQKLFIASENSALNFYEYPSLKLLKSFENRGPEVIIANEISTVATFNDHGSDVKLYNYKTLEKTGEIKKASVSEIQYVSFSPDGKQILYQFFDHQMKAHLGIWNLEKNQDAVNPFDTVTNMMGKLSFSPDYKKIAIFRPLYQRNNVYESNTGLQIYDYQSGRLIYSADDLMSFAFHPSGDKIFVCDYDGSVKLINYITGQEIATWVRIGENDYVITTPDMYFTASKGALNNIAFRIGTHAFPFEQFDLQYNRPDIVLKRIGLAPQPLIDSYYRSYQRRLKKMNFNESMFSEDMHLPEIAFQSQGLPVSTDKKKLTFRVKASDSKYLLDRLNVYVNDVPIYGLKGLDLSSRNISQTDQEISLNLSNGNNKIQISVLNSKGVESLKETVNITCTAPHTEPTLYILAIGVSRYKESIYNLNYADKDASDLTAEFESLKGITFGDVRALVLNNEKATRDGIISGKKFFQASKEDDMAIVFYAGHGIVDSQMDYYLGTYDIDFTDPANNGLPYDEINNLLDGIPARNKLLMIDACFSGEIEKSDIQFISATSDSGKASIKFRSFSDKKGFIIKKEMVDNAVAFQQNMFTDLRRGTGAVVISSSSGDEYSLEGSDWKNGVFTYSILEGLKLKKADNDNDGLIHISELQNYVINRVKNLTNGGQTPTIRQENLADDYIILK